MLAYKYRTCQDKGEGNLEVIGGAAVRGEGWKIAILFKNQARKGRPPLEVIRWADSRPLRVDHPLQARTSARDSGSVSLSLQ